MGNRKNITFFSFYWNEGDVLVNFVAMLDDLFRVSRYRAPIDLETGNYGMGQALFLLRL